MTGRSRNLPGVVVADLLSDPSHSSLSSSLSWLDEAGVPTSFSSSVIHRISIVSFAIFQMVKRRVPGRVVGVE